MTLDNILEEIKKAETIVIMAHETPDGDAIGSCLAMKVALKQLGKNADVIIREVPKIFNFLPGREDIKTDSEVERYDLAISLDCADFKRLVGSEYFEKAKQTIVIDHHGSNKMYGDINFVNPVAPACCQILIGMFQYFNINIDKELGTCILTGIITDTGGFKFSNTTSTTFAVLSCLTKQDIQPDKIVHDCVDLVKRNYFELTKCAFNSVKFFEDGKIAVSLLTKHDLEANNVERDTAKFMQFYLQNVEGVKIAVSISEGQKNEFHISLRTACDDVDVSAIAKRFGGGGHVRASGLTLKGELKKALNALLLECKKSLKGQNAN